MMSLHECKFKSGRFGIARCSAVQISEESMKVIDLLTRNERIVDPKGILSRKGETIVLRFFKYKKDKIYAFIFKDPEEAELFQESVREFLVNRQLNS